MASLLWSAGFVCSHQAAAFLLYWAKKLIILLKGPKSSPCIVLKSHLKMRMPFSDPETKHRKRNKNSQQFFSGWREKKFRTLFFRGHKIVKNAAATFSGFKDRLGWEEKEIPTRLDWWDSSRDPLSTPFLTSLQPFNFVWERTGPKVSDEAIALKDYRVLFSFI